MTTTRGTCPTRGRKSVARRATAATMRSCGRAQRARTSRSGSKVRVGARTKSSQAAAGCERGGRGGLAT
eukprot:4819522-Prymnesium_polylepis.1